MASNVKGRVTYDPVTGKGKFVPPAPASMKRSVSAKIAARKKPKQRYGKG